MTTYVLQDSAQVGGALPTWYIIVSDLLEEMNVNLFDNSPMLFLINIFFPRSTNNQTCETDFQLDGTLSDSSFIFLSFF